ncbi:hypothetical protein SmJEL517_g02678 [Synchytrium microbalum]|uniref:TMPIT-like protein n=1 Tax=Synchytrium microbalum TaxID=1806994 RepID=A0A507C4U8_9FUNG|nr:uncharacterized protein SmJEL517_g02678 [Synchytrium microbalum]TPX34702.1 hypothetical protein SmJEL517_g02678 [Synchytrium microbalum]
MATATEDGQPDAAMEELLNEAHHLVSEIKQLESKAAHYNSLAEQIHVEETTGIKELAKSRKLVKEFTKRAEKTLKSPDAPVELGESLAKLERKLKQLEFQYPRPPSFILRWALGTSGPFVLKPLKLRLAYKQEYESFKLNMTILSTILAALNWFFLDNRVVDALHSFVLLYYYSTVTLRELILLVNGSRIRNWWLMHHVLSVVLMGAIVIWPKTYCYSSFRTSFLQFSITLGVIQYLQYRYQIHRLYVLRSLDLAGPMDVVGDGLHVQHLERDLALLIPFVLAGQLFQLYNGYQLGQLWWSGVCTETHTPVAALLFFVLGLGNAFTTIKTYLSRRGADRKNLMANYYSPLSPVGRVGSSDNIRASNRSSSSDRLHRSSSSDKLKSVSLAMTAISPEKKEEKKEL